MVSGMEPRGIYLRATPPAHFFILYLKPGLTKFRKPHWVAEAVREPWSSGLSLPNAGITSVRHQAWLRPIFYFIWKQGLTKLLRASLSSWGWPWTWILLSPHPECWDYKRAPPSCLNCTFQKARIKSIGSFHHKRKLLSLNIRDWIYPVAWI